MRIFVATGPFPPDPGGPATHLAFLLPELIARGHEVRALAYGDASRDGGSPCPVTRIPLAPLPIRQLRFALAYRAGAAWADVVYTTCLGLPGSGRGRPTVLRVPGDRAWERAVSRGLVPPTEDIDRFQQARYGAAVRWLRAQRSREARRAARVIAPSRYVRDMVVGWGVEPERVSVVPSAVPAPPLPALDRAGARRALGWAPGAPYLLAVARLTPWKGIDLAIDALAVFRDVTLVVAGDGPTRPALEARARRAGVTTQFLGAMPRAGLAPYLNAADYVLAYSGYEGLSHGILEALHAGTPVIASDRGGNPEVLRDGENGLLVRHPDRAALEGAFARAFAAGTQARLASGARHGLDAFSWPAAVRSIVETLERTAGSAPRRGR
jgi:glycosyltransferase involved in cell wall biosynthesis